MVQAELPLSSPGESQARGESGQGLCAVHPSRPAEHLIQHTKGVELGLRVSTVPPPWTESPFCANVLMQN